MKRNGIIFAMLALVAVDGQAQPSKVLEVKQLTLSNGLTVWLNEDHSQPKVYGELVVKAGAKDCPNTGIAHYLEHVLFKGTQRIGTTDYQAEKVWLDSISMKYNELSQTTDAAQRLSIQQDISRLSQRAADYAIPNEYNRLISRYGGSALNASTTYDATEYHNTFAPQFLEQWCWLNSERMIDPVFRLFQGELETVYEEKNRAADNMIAEAMERVMASAFKGHPYQYPIIGSTESLKNPRLSDMEDFFRKYYVATNMGLMLCGDFDSSTIAPLLEHTFGRLPKGATTEGEKHDELQPFGGETIDIKLNVPLIKALGLLFRGPMEKAGDFLALKLAMRLLTNDNATGLLDSLRTAHKVMMAGGDCFAFNEAGAVGLLVIPKVPFGSKKKAEQLCWKQIERVKQGDFTNARLEELKLSLLKEAERDLETITDRAESMASVFSQGRSWTDFLSQIEAVRSITKADVVAAARRYLLSDYYLRAVKKFGSYPKDKVSQPDYKPVVPRNAHEQSLFAKELEALPVAALSPRLVDLDHDVEIKGTKGFTIYRVENPVNDLFSLSLKWHKGTLAEPRLALLEAYIDELGTDSLTKHQLGEAWQRLGTTLEAKSSERYFMLTLHGFDHNLTPSLQLLRHQLTSLKADRKALKELQSEYNMSRQQLTRDNQDIMQMVMQKILKGDQSEYLRMPSAKEVKRLTGDDLLHLLDDLRHYPCDVLYSGRQTMEELSAALSPLSAVPSPLSAAPDYDTPLQQYQHPMVYLYDMPDTRQTYIALYLCPSVLPTGAAEAPQTPPGLTDRDEALLRLWSQYIGGGMSSLLFQEIREFRSMAYATGGQDITPNRVRHRDYPSGFIAYLGTQGDKTMQALAVLDSLMTQMPMNEQSLLTARQEVMNDINNSYPTYRQLPNFVSSFRMAGYTSDPRSNIASIVPTLTAADVTDFYEQHIRQQPRVVFIVGNKRKLDLQQLSRYGQVVELKKRDIVR